MLFNSAIFSKLAVLKKPSLRSVFLELFVLRKPALRQYFFRCTTALRSIFQRKIQDNFQHFPFKIFKEF